MTRETAAEASRQIHEMNLITRVWGAQTGAYDVTLADGTTIRIHAADGAAEELRSLGYVLTAREW